MDAMPTSRKLHFSLHARTRLHRLRVETATARIAEWLDLVRHPYVAFSTGKDSTVVLHMVRSARAGIPAVYLDADSTFPESETMMNATENLVRFPTDEPMLDILARHGLAGGADLDRAIMQSVVWGPIRRLIEAYGYDGVALGLRADECHGRYMNAHTRGAIYQYRRDGLWACQPIWDWHYDDVWAYIVAHAIPYCGVYDRMWDAPEEDQRLSYWAGDAKLRWGRYAWLKRNYPELFNRLAVRIPEVRAYV